MNPTTSADALKQMQDFSSTRKSLTDIYSGAEQELGVSDAQKRANELKALASGTEKLIKGVDPSVTGRMQGSMATEAQRQRMVALETQPLSELYQTQTGAYELGQNEYNNALTRAQQLASQRYSSDTDKYNMLKDIYGTLQGQEAAAEDRRRYEAEMARMQAVAAEDTRRWEADQENARRALAASQATFARMQANTSQNESNSKKASLDSFNRPDTKKSAPKPITKAQQQANNRNIAKNAGLGYLASILPQVGVVKAGYDLTRAVPKGYNKLKDMFGF